MPIADLKAALDAATASPWTVVSDGMPPGAVALGGFDAAADAALAVHARDLCPALLELYAVIDAARLRLIGPTPRTLLKAQRLALAAALAKLA